MDSITEELPLTPDAWESRARALLPAATYDYYAGGAGDERTLRANRDAWSDLFLRPRVLVDVSEVDTSLRLLGLDLPHPILLAPTAFQRLAHPEGELATARAAGATGSLLVASSLSTTPIDEIGRVATGPLWLQLYVFRDRALAAELVQRGRAAGCRAVCLTVSVPVQGNRERDAHNRFRLPDGLSMANFTGYLQANFPDLGPGSGLDRFIAQQFDPRVTWTDVERLRETAGAPVVLKGILTREDARLAVEHGAAAVIVSNHGGRQLEGALPTAHALREVVEGVDGRIPVLVDGGIRRGGDVVRALALGAAAVLIGRPYLWGLAVGGQRGVERVVELLVADVRRTLALIGRASLGDVDRSVLAS
ncbi:MAG: alpha-hydroxy-acid oxidizing protein [Gemmatimonadetes bacterium]|nr:alpha-hydroxy-acid oxidizing protein [Gemmatimonadota bacterium]